MLQAILNELDDDALDGIGLIYCGLQMEPATDGVHLTIPSRSSLYEQGPLFLNARALRQLATVLTAAADAIEAAKEKVPAD